jgi:hypothetical protein
MPRRPGCRKWPAWQLLTPHAAHVLDNLTAEPDRPDNAARPAAHAVHMAARYQPEQGLHV